MTNEQTLPAPPGIHASHAPHGRAAAARPASAVDGVAIVVPARNEEALIARCLDALAVAVTVAAAAAAADGVAAADGLAAAPDRAVAAADADTDGAPNSAGPAIQARGDLAIVTVVVVDSSDDRTAAIARSYTGVDVIISDAGNVGEARRAGVAHALRLLTQKTAAAGAASSFSGEALHDPSRLWIANTDADSAVPSTWLAEQLASAERGADALLGTIRPDLSDFTPAQRAILARDHPRTEAAGHIHGANLGVRANAYLSAGGFSGLAEHEDIDLVARLKDQDARIVASADAEVLTSGRLSGRTPGGYAGFLRDALPPR